MANDEHLKILKQGVKAWNEWKNHNLVIPDLARADLARTNLAGAKLSSADLTGAKLAGADLTHADLAVADLTDANLCGANLSGARFGYTILAHVDMSEARGLDAAEHVGPSTIGLDTFFMSNGKIPEIFLRGAGVPDIFLDYAASLTGTPLKLYSCFISYSHADKPFARRLHAALQGRGVRCWLDEKQLLPGDHIQRAVDEAVRTWDKVLLCCSNNSLNSWWVDKEVQKALMKEEHLWKERGKEVLVIIPLNLDGYVFKPEWQDWKKQHLTARMAADFTGWEKDDAKFQAQFERVVKSLRTDAGAREQPPKPRL